MKIKVSSGGLTRTVTATNPFDAVKVFIEKHQPKSLGFIASCEGKELDDTYYVSTERVLREMGKWKGPGMMEVKP